SSELVGYLSHPNGWFRDTAQRLLVERNDSNVVTRLKSMLTTDANRLARLHALWTLDGMRRIDPATIRAALKDSDPKLRANAIRVSELFLYSQRRAELLP